MSMLISPMRCELGSLASLEAREGDPDWIAERKYDGERIVAQFDKDRVSMWTRRDMNVSHKFPEVVEAIRGALRGKGHTVIDGELVAGASFKDLGRRQSEDRLTIKIMSKKLPATYVVFDVLVLDGKNVMSLQLSDRKNLLDESLRDSSAIELAPVFSSDGLRARFDQFVHEDCEGIIIKRLSSTYQAGKRSRDWVKVKKSITVEVEIVGAVRSEAGQAFKSIIMMHDGRYFGLVGTGFSEEDRRRIFELLGRDPVDKPAIPLPEGVDPVVLNHPKRALITVLEISNTGMPRAPVWIGFKE